MYCKFCGQQIDDSAAFCPVCGKQLKESSAVVEDAPNLGMALLGFFIPIVGLVMYFVLEKTEPLKAKSAGKGALISVIVSAVVTILILVIYLVGFGFMLS